MLISPKNLFLDHSARQEKEGGGKRKKKVAIFGTAGGPSFIRFPMRNHSQQNEYTKELEESSKLLHATASPSFPRKKSSRQSKRQPEPSLQREGTGGAGAHWRGGNPTIFDPRFFCVQKTREKKMEHDPDIWSGDHSILHASIPKRLTTALDVLALLNTIEHPFMKNRRGFTPLHLAAMHGKTSIVGLLLSMHHPLSVTDSDGRTPIHLAALYNKPRSVFNCFLFLFFFSFSDCFYLFFQQGLLKLLEFDADINCKDTQGNTPLHLASDRGYHPEMVTLLLEHDGDPHTVNRAGMIPGEALLQEGLKVSSSQDLQAVEILRMIFNNHHMKNLTLLWLTLPSLQLYS